MLHPICIHSYVPNHKIMVCASLMRGHTSNMHVQLSIKALDKIDCLSLHPQIDFMNANSEGSDETARMRRLA